MKHYAQIENNLVIRVIVLNDEDTIAALNLEGTWIETQNAGIGYNYDPQTNSIYAPVSVVVEEG